LKHPQIELVSASYDIYIIDKKGKNIPKFKEDPHLCGIIRNLISKSKKKELNKVKSKSDNILRSREVQISSLVVVPIVDDDENDDFINWDEPD